MGVIAESHIKKILLDILKNSVIHKLVIQRSYYKDIFRIKYCKEMSERNKNNKLIKNSPVISAF